MALPWLLGAAAAAAVTATIAALSDDSSGSSTSYSDNENEERRRAAKEREERQREEKMEALEVSYDERLEIEGTKMTELLRNFVEVDDVQQSMVIIECVMDLEMNPDGSDKDLLTRQIVQNKSTLDIFHSNIAFFEQLYGVYIESKAEVVQVSEAIDSLKNQTKKIDKLIKELSE